MKTLLILFLLMISFATHADLKCQLLYKGNKKLYPGLPVSAQMIFWPKEEFNLASFQKQNKKGEYLLGVFYISHISNVMKSPNNEEAVVIDMDVVPLKSFDLSMVQMYADGFNSCAVDFRGFIFAKEDKPVKPQIKMVDQNADELREPMSWVWYVVAAVVVFTIYPLILLLLTWNKKRKDKKKILLRKEYYSHLFNSAESRRDFEKIYLLRKEWLPLLQNNQHSVEHFFDTINKIQFREQWSEEELVRCKESFLDVKRSWHG